MEEVLNKLRPYIYECIMRRGDKKQGKREYFRQGMAYSKSEKQSKKGGDIEKRLLPILYGCCKI